MKSTIWLFPALMFISSAQALVPQAADCIYDYTMITAQECRDYRAKVLAAQSEGERFLLRSELEQLMSARALERGVPVYHWRGIDDLSSAANASASGASTAILVAGLAALVVVVFLVLLALWPVRRMRLMRCPETGTIAFVDAGPVVRAGGKEPVLAVRSCELWPRRSHCAQGCLERCEAATPGMHARLDALRPFQQP